MAQLKSTLVQGALTVTGNAVASKLIKNGGTSDDILLGDGSTTSKSALMAMINAAVVLKGTAGTNGTVTKTTFPAASESTLGNAYKVITEDTYQGVAAKVGDMLICYYTGSSYAWMLIPSGDDIEDTWREIKVNGTQILANGTTTNPLNLKAGTNMTLTNSNGTVTFDATDTGATTVSITGDGNAFTNAEYNASTRTITFTKSTFLTSHQSLANYVTLDGVQTITGVKTFSAQPVISAANGLKFDSGNCKLRIYNTSASPTDYAAIEVRSNSTSTNRNLFIDLANNSLVVGEASGTADTTYKVNVKDTFNATTIYENGTSLATKYAAKGHNHDVNIATSTGTNELTLVHGTKYALTAGGQSFIFTMPTDSDTTYGADRGISLKDGKFGHSNTAVTAVTTAGLYKIKYDAYGHITGTESFTLPTVNNGTLTIQKNGTKVATFTANQSGNTTANITVPTKVSELTNDSNFLTAETDTLQTVTTRGATTDKSITALSYSVNSAVTMEYDSSYKALKFVFA